MIRSNNPSTKASRRLRVHPRSPVRSFRTPGSARGAPGDRRPYLNLLKMLRLPTMILAAMIAGCANHQVAKRQPVMVLDNNGGFSHAGRRIELFEGGGASEISYTDVADAQHVSNGTYELRGDRLALKFGDRGDQSLHRVTYGDKAYWVYAKESEKIMRPGSSWLRQTSLKQQGEQVIDANLPSTSQSPRSANH